MFLDILLAFFFLYFRIDIINERGKKEQLISHIS